MKGTQRSDRPSIRVAILVAAVFSTTLAACSSGGEETYDSAWVGTIERDVKVSGSVGQGLTTNAAVTIRKKTGEAITDFKSDASAHYEVDLAAREADFPLLIDAAGGRDLVTSTAPDFVLRSAVFSPRERVTANINPFSTITVELASNLNGGLTRENLLEAERIVASSLNSGLKTLASSGPVQTPVGGTNLAELVKSSAVLAEIVRRTRDELNSAGYGVSADAVIEALGADLIDGVIEGNGGAGADPRTALDDSRRIAYRLHPVDRIEGSVELSTGRIGGREWLAVSGTSRRNGLSVRARNFITRQLPSSTDSSGPQS